MSLVEIKQLKYEITRLEEERREMKLEGMSMKQLDGVEVEWEIKNLDKLKEGEEIEGPTFFVNNYKLRMYFIFRGLWNYFYLGRIKGEFDRNLGLDYVTHYRVVNANKQSYNESEYQEGIMNYQLKIGTKSEKIQSSYFRDVCLLRFYFGVNSNLVERF